MADIYQHSKCNIAATRAKDGSEGCLPIVAYRQSPSNRLRAAFEATPSYARHSDNARVKYKGLSDEEADKEVFFTFEPSIWTGEVQKSTLLTRAWVLQELVLANRVLHCDQNQLFWECNELQASETYPSGIPGQPLVKDNMSGLRDPYEHWHSLVTRYTKLALTYPDRDKLVAIAGLAKRMRLPTEEYLAGLWKGNLENDLVWFVPWNFAGAADSEDALEAPSWSWSSCSKVIYFAQPGEKYTSQHEVGNILTKILHAEVTPNTTDSTGRTAKGKISLEGTIGYANFRTRADYTNRGDRADRIEIDGGQFANVHFDRHTPGTNSMVYYLPIQMREANTPESRRKLGYGGYEVEGLIIEPTGRAKGKYRRRGYFSSFAPHRNLLDALKESDERMKGKIECEEIMSMSEHGFARYKISFV